MVVPLKDELLKWQMKVDWIPVTFPTCFPSYGQLILEKFKEEGTEGDKGRFSVTYETP